ncbi:MAG: response regulator [Phycisphaeraceae bacterium]|nr:MAG: response regulator [Phycisphaeraceae bacterium]
MMSKTVLVVDDESHILHVVSLKLGNAGYEVLTAGDGEEGYELACQSLPDLIITDLQMPYMTGVEMCARLKRNKATASIPALLLTARGYALGADDLQRTSIRHVLSKPFSPRELLDMIAEILGESAGDGKAREAA